MVLLIDQVIRAQVVAQGTQSHPLLIEQIVVIADHRVVLLHLVVHPVVATEAVDLHPVVRLVVVLAVVHQEAQVQAQVHQGAQEEAAVVVVVEEDNFV